ncbi:cytochrome P450 [Amycolatopsis magusensis]|uniref:Pentalenene oxygenase n=1 Tax=Amycolatopsis magusensis TaxID=882444 RepID=A0ABS4PW96_9PSEU|nr:cytochrome P450 [Amycolatopsis magusensis]MBP2183704.1 pentalenene oxygenase [Amycolatopsis magusensis]
MRVPSAPWALPVAGHGGQLFGWPLRFMTSLNARGPVVRIRSGLSPVYVVTDPCLLRRVLLTDTRDYVKGRLTDRGGPQLGVSLVMDMDFDGMTPFESHRRHRRAVQPAFHPTRIAAHVEALAHEARELAGTWRPGRRVRLDTEFARLACRVNARFFCGSPVGPVAEALEEFKHHLVRGLYWRVPSPAFTDSWNPPGTGGFRRARRRLREAIEAAATRRRSEGDDGSVLAGLIDARYSDTGEALADGQITHEILFDLIASLHGIAAVLPWAFHELARHPDAEQRLHAELDAVLAGRPVTAEDLPRLDFTRRVLQETLRLYPPVWLLARRTLTEVELGPFRLPSGTDLAYVPYALHHNPGLFAEPHRFDPDRWLPERAKTIPDHAYLPFGTGPRKCIGDRLAMTQLLTALATIGSSQRLQPIPGHRARARARIFLTPGPMPMTSHPRPSTVATPHTALAVDRADIDETTCRQP